MDYCFSGTESLWYGSWNRHVCRKGKCASDRPSWSTGVKPSRKRRCCYPSCLRSQAQRDTSDPDIYQNLGYWLTIRHRCICMWSWTEMLIFFFPFESKDCMNSASYEYRNMSARRVIKMQFNVALWFIHWMSNQTHRQKNIVGRFCLVTTA